MKQKILAVIVILGMVLSACDVLVKTEPTMEILPTVTSSKEIVAEGHIVPENYVRLGFTTGGVVNTIAVEDGQIVTAGDVLMVLDGQERAQAAVEAARLEQLSAQNALNDLERYALLQRTQAQQAFVEAQKALIQAKQNLHDVDNEDYRDQVDDLMVEMTDAETELEDAREEFNKYKDLDEDNQKRKDAKQNLDNAQENYDQAVRDYEILVNAKDMSAALVDVALARLADTEKEVDLREQGPDPDENTLAQARLTAANAGLASAQKALADMQLFAPFSGAIADVMVDEKESVAPLQPAVVLMSNNTWYVETNDLTELDVVYLEEGQSVRIVPDALPDLTLKGTIENISDLFDEQSGDITYMVRIRMDDKPEKLRWGMTVTVYITKIGQ